jgi:hypothetical protein
MCWRHVTSTGHAPASMTINWCVYAAIFRWRAFSRGLHDASLVIGVHQRWFSQARVCCRLRNRRHRCLSVSVARRHDCSAARSRRRLRAARCGSADDDKEPAGP